MIGLRIGAAESAEIEAGAPAVVLADGVDLPDCHPLVPLVFRDGVLVRFGETVWRSLPLPPTVPLLALIAPAGALRLRAMLPPGLPVLSDLALLPALLAETLRESTAARLATEAECQRLRRALGALTAPRPRLALDLPPMNGTGAAPPLAQPLGIPAHGVCTVAVHLASPGTGALRVRLLAGERVLGRWVVPEGALAPGWLALDLPEPAVAEAEMAVLELIADETATPPLLTLSGDEPRAGIALRAFTAPPGLCVLPRYFDWAARGTKLPAAPMRVPAELLAATEVEGARAELVATGAAPAHLLIELPPGEAATLRLPPLPVGPADLLIADLALRGAVTGAVEAALHIAGADGTVESGWRELVADRGLSVALPLPPGPMASLQLSLRQAGDTPALVEITGLALIVGAAGEPRRPPPVEAVAAPLRRPVIPVPIGQALPAWRQATATPQVAASRPTVAVTMAASPASVTLRPQPLPAGITAFQEFRLYQHLDSATATYRHIDVGLSGLVSAGGLWRQVRLKLFDRRGVAGIEFRQAKGWPMMFDTWPKGGADAHGPFWRLETEASGESLAALVTPHDRALVLALMEILPEVADRAARAAKVDRVAAAAWATRARVIAEAVAEARNARQEALSARRGDRVG